MIDSSTKIETTASVKALIQSLGFILVNSSNAFRVSVKER